MSKKETFQVVEEIIRKFFTDEGITLPEITPQTHIIDDLGIDSLDMLDIVFMVEQDLKIKINLSEQEENIRSGYVSPEFLRMKNFCAHIDDKLAERS